MIDIPNMKAPDVTKEQRAAISRFVNECIVAIPWATPLPFDVIVATGRALIDELYLCGPVLVGILAERGYLRPDQRPDETLTAILDEFDRYYRKRK
jgi:hypothetical protein